MTGKRRAMTESVARKILGGWIQPDDSLSCWGPFVCLSNVDKRLVTLDGEFTARQVAAVAWWMANKW